MYSCIFIILSFVPNNLFPYSPPCVRRRVEKHVERRNTYFTHKDFYRNPNHVIRTRLIDKLIMDSEMRWPIGFDIYPLRLCEIHFRYYLLLFFLLNYVKLIFLNSLYIYIYIHVHFQPILL